MTNILSTEKQRVIRIELFKSVLSEGYFAMNHYGMLLGFAYGGNIGLAFKQKIRQIQRVEKRKLMVEDVIALYESFERDLNR
jgi:hypothetical protein